MKYIYGLMMSFLGWGAFPNYLVEAGLPLNSPWNLGISFVLVATTVVLSLNIKFE